METVLARRRAAPDTSLFVYLALAMAAVLVLGFSLHLGMGRSSFAAPMYVHAHALIFFGWTALFVTQTLLAATNNRALHRRLGWIAVGWAATVIVMGTSTTVLSVRAGRTPFFFTPAYFVLMNPASVLCFGGLSAAAVMQRRDTGWHRRLMVCGMAVLTAPGWGRLLPLPLLIPWAGWATFVATLVFPVAGALADWRLRGRVHRAWLVGIAAMTVVQIAVALLAATPVGGAVYRAATVGSPAAGADPFAYPAPPWA